ncbi:MAG: exonuclease SbcCD subunit D [Euzebyales bacterium]|nr:exonuclease SbcCD subunit D [Euzebyales bacterium]
MRILHTSDWHVGRTIRGRSRAAEHQAVLAEIVRIAGEEAVDLVLVAGDQFDTAAPTPEAERIVYRALSDLTATGAQVVVVSGNHDNPARLAAVTPLLAASRVHVGALLARPEEGGVATVTTDAGETARIALLPFLSQRAIVRADDLMALHADQHAGQYAARATAIIAALSAGFRTDAVNLAAAHLMVAGGTMGGGERSAHTIFDYCIAATAFPESAHYVALGHLHRLQQVPAACPVWYSGSPLQLDFGETQDTKAVLVVDASPGAPAEVRQFELTEGRRLRTLRGSLEQLQAQAGTTGEDYLRVVVRGQARVGLAEQVREWFPDAVDVIVEAPEAVGADIETPSRIGRSPAELFSEYLASHGGTDDRVLALFAELFDEVSSVDTSSVDPSPAGFSPVGRG